MFVNEVEYSKAEKTLIEAISPHWHQLLFGHNNIDVVVHTSNAWINPTELYKILAYESFIENKSGPAYDALRKVCRAIDKCSPYRMTQSFDDLCKFGDSNG